MSLYIDWGVVSAVATSIAAFGTMLAVIVAMYQAKTARRQNEKLHVQNEKLHEMNRKLQAQNMQISQDSLKHASYNFLSLKATAIHVVKFDRFTQPNISNVIQLNYVPVENVLCSEEYAVQFTFYGLSYADTPLDKIKIESLSLMILHEGLRDNSSLIDTFKAKLEDDTYDIPVIKVGKQLANQKKLDMSNIGEIDYCFTLDCHIPRFYNIIQQGNFDKGNIEICISYVNMLKVKTTFVHILSLVKYQNGNRVIFRSDESLKFVKISMEE